MDFAEEIPLLDLELPLSLDPAEVPKFYEAFKEFDDQDSGFVLISVKIIHCEIFRIRLKFLQITSKFSFTLKLPERLTTLSL